MSFYVQIRDHSMRTWGQNLFFFEFQSFDGIFHFRNCGKSWNQSSSVKNDIGVKYFYKSLNYNLISWIVGLQMPHCTLSYLRILKQFATNLLFSSSLTPKNIFIVFTIIWLVRWSSYMQINRIGKG